MQTEHGAYYPYKTAWFGYLIIVPNAIALGDDALLAAWCTKEGNYFPLFLFYFFYRELYNVTVNKQPSAGEKDAPLSSGVLSPM